MRYFLAFVLLVLGLLAYLILTSKGPSPPARHGNLTPERVRMMVEALYKRGYHGGLLFVTVRDDVPFVQVRKEISEGLGVSLRSDFPCTDWSESYYPKVRGLLTELNIPFEERSGPSDVPTDGDTWKVLVIQFGTDTIAVARFIEAVFERVFQVDVQSQGVAEFRAVSSFDRRIGFAK